jgi:hypothetical protein
VNETKDPSNEAGMWAGMWWLGDVFGRIRTLERTRAHVWPLRAYWAQTVPLIMKEGEGTCVVPEEMDVVAGVCVFPRRDFREMIPCSVL